MDRNMPEGPLYDWGLGQFLEAVQKWEGRVTRPKKPPEKRPENVYPREDQVAPTPEEQYGKHIRDPAVRDQFEGKPIRIPPSLYEHPRYHDLYDILDDANEAEQQDWSFFKGFLLGVTVVVVFVLAYVLADWYYTRYN